MLSIKTNTTSLIAQNSLKTSTNNLNQAIERMNSGAKINHAKDNAANYSIATNYSTKLSALQIAEDNCAMGLDLISTASSSLEQMSDLTSCLRLLATQAQNGTYGSKSIEAINVEAQAIIQEMSRIKDTTNYNGIKLLSNENKRDTSSMTTLASVDETVALTNGSYSISTAEELAKLATITNNGLVEKNTEFVLANDIDLSAYSTGEGWTPIGIDSSNYFSATFDGNGYTISNLYINRPSSKYQGLFGATSSTATIKNVGVKDVNITGFYYVGGLVGNSIGTIHDCYTNGIVTGTRFVGGLVGYEGAYANISNSYSTASVKGYIYTGGLVGNTNGIIRNSYATGDVTGNSYLGGLVGIGNDATLENTYYSETTGQTEGIGTGTPTSGFATLVTDIELDKLIEQGILPDYKTVSSENTGSSTKIDNTLALVLDLQVGINSLESSQINFEVGGIDLSALNNLDLTSNDVFTTLDDILSKINYQQTSLGAVQNRLESALDEISTQYDNLVSSRSTIMDADMAELSAEYIKMQILQQASATLMATANQSPSIALQLL